MKIPVCNTNSIFFSNLISTIGFSTDAILRHAFDIYQYHGTKTALGICIFGSNWSLCVPLVIGTLILFPPTLDDDFEKGTARPKMYPFNNRSIEPFERE